MATPSSSRIAVKPEPGTVPSRRSRAELESEPDEASPSQPTKRTRSDTLEQSLAAQNEDDDAEPQARVALMRDATG